MNVKALPSLMVQRAIAADLTEGIPEVISLLELEVIRQSVTPTLLAGLSNLDSLAKWIQPAPEIPPLVLNTMKDSVLRRIFQFSQRVSISPADLPAYRFVCLNLAYMFQEFTTEVYLVVNYNLYLGISQQIAILDAGNPLRGMSSMYAFILNLNSLSLEADLKGIVPISEENIAFALSRFLGEST